MFLHIKLMYFGGKSLVLYYVMHSESVHSDTATASALAPAYQNMLKLHTKFYKNSCSTD